MILQFVILFVKQIETFLQIWFGIARNFEIVIWFEIVILTKKICSIWVFVVF